MLQLQGIGIYTDSGTNPWNVCQYHFDQLVPKNNHTQLGTYYNQDSFKSFLSHNYQIKFAAYHVSFPAVDSWVERFDILYPNVLHSFVFCSELHQVTVEQLKHVDRPNVTIFLAGILNINFKQAKIKTWMDWFITSSYFYKNVKPTLLAEKLTYLGHKPKFFDVLLGCQRSHRDYVYEYIVANNLQSQVLLTYHKRWNQDLRLSDQYVTEDQGVEYDDPPKHTVQGIKYYGYHMNMSQVIPIKIYNQTNYSLVAETNAVNDFNFYTEKIVKPLIAKRLFVVIAGQNYLKNLKSFGFKTFEAVIDESYDQEPNNELRWKMSLDQLKYLCTQDSQIVNNQVKEIVEHNHRLILNQDWYNDFSQEFWNEIVDIVGR